MFSHSYIGVSDLERAQAFYAPLMELLGHVLKFSASSMAAWKPKDADRPLFIIGAPNNGEAPAPGNGQMIALLAPRREVVVDCYNAAIAQGARCEGPPGLRPHYHPNYYGADFRDPDGNKLGVCCHNPEPAP